MKSMDEKVFPAKLKNTFHVRLVASRDKRIEHIQHLPGFDEKEAIGHIKKKDETRKIYLKTYFNADIEEPLNYHLVVNTDLLTHVGAAKLIAEAVVLKFSELFPQFAR